MKLRFNFSACVTMLLTFALNGAAQGRFAFHNNTATRITNAITGSAATVLTVAMYFSADTNAALNYELPMTPNPGAVTNYLLQPGMFAGGIRSVPGVPAGNYIAVEIRGWDGNYTNWSDAYKAWNCHENVLVGQSSRFVIGPLTDDPDLAASLLGVGKLQPFVLYPNTGITICEPPILSVVPGSVPFRLRIDGHPQEYNRRFQVQMSTSLASNSWQVLTDLFPTNFPTFWTDPQGTNSPRFYRVWVNVN